LQARADLNGRTGRVIGPETKERFPVRVDGSVDEVLVRLQNLQLFVSEARSKVLESRELLDLIFDFVPRWERAGRATGVARLWKLCVRSNPDLYKHVVLCGTSYRKPSASDMVNKLARFSTSPRYTVVRHVLHNALPLYPDELKEMLLVPEEERDAGEDDTPAICELIETLAVPAALAKDANKQPRLSYGDTDDEDEWGEDEVCIDTHAVGIALNLCQSVKSISVDLSDFEGRAIGKGKRGKNGCSPAFRPGGPVDRWFLDAPESLEYVQFIDLDADCRRWWHWNPCRLPNLRGFSLFEFPLAEVATWPEDVRGCWPI
jgi:hypothetical protein